jgi:uncharacterized repeat protein (TIGR01451 family)
LPQILGRAYQPFQNVPTDYALYVETALSATTTPTTSNVYGMFIPQSISNSGLGACIFVTSDSSLFDDYSFPAGTQPAQNNAIAHAFTAAALNTDSACGLPPTVEITKTADVTTALAAGTTEHYTVTVTNTSSSLPVTNVLVSDPVPTGIDAATVTWHCDGAAGPATDGAGALNQTLVSLPAGASVVYTITATAGAAVPATERRLGFRP